MNQGGEIGFIFNQKLYYPEVAKNLDSTTIKDYFELRYYNSYEYLFDKEMNFEFSIKEWTEENMIIKIYFEKPQLISKSELEDKFYAKILKP